MPDSGVFEKYRKPPITWQSPITWQFVATVVVVVAHFPAGLPEIRGIGEPIDRHHGAVVGQLVEQDRETWRIRLGQAWLLANFFGGVADDRVRRDGELFSGHHLVGK